jgi:hypothetical protein
MNSMEIFMAITGIVIIIVSCIITNRDKSTAGQPAIRIISATEALALTEEEIKQVKARVEEVLTEVSEEVRVRTDDELVRLSNEKIIAVNDFSEQVLEKIKNNHEEVVFLYNMLNEKEKELKAAVKEIDAAKRKLHEIAEARRQAAAERAAVKTEGAVPAKEQGKKEDGSNGVQQYNSDNNAHNNGGANNKDQILALYSEGKSVVEISRLLRVGQGEVKLVIDLYKNKK